MLRGSAALLLAACWRAPAPPATTPVVTEVVLDTSGAWSVADSMSPPFELTLVQTGRAVKGTWTILLGSGTSYELVGSLDGRRLEYMAVGVTCNTWPQPPDTSVCSRTQWSGRADFDADLRRFRRTMRAAVEDSEDGEDGEDLDEVTHWQGVRVHKATQTPPPRP